MPVTVLEREMYTEAGAARLLGIAQNTLNYWLEGGQRRGKQYRPVIRLEPKGERAGMTWGEFIEAGLLRQYRAKNVPMPELRAFIDKIREEYGAPYPLADRRRYILGRELIIEAQNDAQLDAEFCLVAFVRDQLVLTPVAEAFMERVDWDGNLPARWRPHGDPASPVRMDPAIRSGMPAIHGVRTEVIWEHSEAGETDDEIAGEFDMPIDSVRWAMAYETSARSRTTSARAA
jgi:uncharacterized protein (DUF433 family)